MTEVAAEEVSGQLGISKQERRLTSPAQDPRYTLLLRVVIDVGLLYWSSW
jgi:hypothetical protein